MKLYSNGLLDLLLVIAIIVHRLPLIIDPSERLFRLFQRFWFYSVLYELVDLTDSSHSAVYINSLRLIATKSPTLVAQHLFYIPLKATMPLKVEHISKVHSQHTH